MKSPYAIQQFLDSIPYNTIIECRSPLQVLKEPRAHCFEGALFAAYALRQIGYPPLIVDMRAENDDDHVIAVFKQQNHWGAVAKSNTSALRFREPVYKTLRELMMSYFDFYFNVEGEKSLRSYSRPVNLARFDKNDWMATDDDLEYIGDYLNELSHIPLVDNEMIRNFNMADELLKKAVFLGADEDGLYKA